MLWYLLETISSVYNKVLKKKLINNERIYWHIKIMKNNDAKNSIKNLHPSSEKSILKSRKQSFDNEKIKNEELNDLPYTLALNLDKRSIVQIFYSLIIQKLEINHHI